MRDEDRFRSQAAYCREQATITAGAQAAQWLKIAAEYDKLLQAIIAPLRVVAQPVMQQQQQPQPKPDDEKLGHDHPIR
jgi:hypothetical protein